MEQQESSSIQEMPRKNKAGIWILLIFILIGTGAYIYMNHLDSTDSCKDIGDNKEKDNCYYNLAYETKDSQFCEKILLSRGSKDECYIDIAKTYSDVLLCSKVSDIKEYNYEPTKRDYCYFGIYQNTKDPSLCDKLSEGNLKWNDCFMDALENIRKTKDSTNCQNISTVTYRDLCYNILAVELQDSSICNKVWNPEIKQTCLNLEIPSK